MSTKSEEHLEIQHTCGFSTSPGLQPSQPGYPRPKPVQKISDIEIGRWFSSLTLCWVDFNDLISKVNYLSYPKMALFQVSELSSTQMMFLYIGMLAFVYSLQVGNIMFDSVRCFKKVPWLKSWINTT